MIWIITLVTIPFVTINYYIGKKDIFSPGFVFCGVFLFSEIVCILESQTFNLDFHYQTLLVLVVGFIAFTLVSWVSVKHYNSLNIVNLNRAKSGSLKSVHVNGLAVYLLIIIQIIVIGLFIGYLSSIATAYGQAGLGLNGKIELFDKLTKFLPDDFKALQVPVPILYRILNPIAEAGAYITIYVAVNNYCYSKKLHLWTILPIILLCFQIVLNGSRTPLFRIITMMMFLVYMFKIKNSSAVVRRRFIKVIIILLGVVAISFIMILIIMGRGGTEMSLNRYLFIYTGAPLANLDTYLSSENINHSSQLFAQQTFRNLYQYLEKLTGFSIFGAPNILFFQTSPSGVEIGNVYTTFYQFFYDFGYIGVFVFTAIMAAFYNIMYLWLCKARNFLNGHMSYQLFIYSYLFNDLIMSIFSNRFYETILEPPFIKIAIISAGIVFFIVNWRYRNDSSIGKKIDDFYQRIQSITKRLMTSKTGRS